jgi:hypothetical protein
MASLPPLSAVHPTPSSASFQPGTTDIITVPLGDPSYLGDDVNAIIITLTLLLCCMTVILNLGLMTHFWSNINNIYNSTVPIIYFVLSLSDFVTGICAGLHTILFSLLLVLRGRSELSTNLLWIVVPSYFLSVVAFKVSAFVSMTFAIIRTINVAFPFYQVNGRAAITSILIWLSFWVIVSSVEIGVQGKLLRRFPEDNLVQSVLVAYFYQPNKPKLIQNIILLYFPDNDEGIGDGGYKADCAVDLLYTALPVFLCAAVNLIVTLVQIAILLGGKVVEGKAGSDHLEMRRRMCVTVILIGVVFIVCSSCSLYQPLHVCDKGYGDEYTGLYFMGYFPFFINAALNPLILIMRVQELRQDLWTRVSGKNNGYLDRHQDMALKEKRRSENLTSATDAQSMQPSHSGFRRFLHSLSG